MNRITLLRHAKSSWKNPDLSDFDRPLNARGKNDAPMMGRICSERLPVPDLILLSPAERTRLTVEALITAWNPGEVPVFKTDMLYLAGLEEWIETVSEYENEAGHLLVCGHQPGIGSFARWLIPGFSAEIPTAGVVSILLSEGAIGRGKGELDFYAVPRQFKKRADRNERP